MLNVALLAAAVALASTVAADSTTAPATQAAAPCRAAGTAPELACPLHALEADPNAAPADIAALVPPATTGDWTPPRSDDGLAFKDAATDTTSVLPASVDHDRQQRLLPALLALGALVILLRRRPT
jgi:hypothetical protein